jgi:PAS domain S-box-containing protein
MMEVKQYVTHLDATETLAALLDEVSAITDYRTLRDSLPRRLARLLCCRCVLLYQRNGETLQLAAGSFDDSPGWSPSLLAVAHINPINLNSDLLEAQAWRARRAVTAPTGHAPPNYIAVPLLYRQRGIGVLVAIREGHTCETQPLMLQMDAPQHEQAILESWSSDETRVVEVIAGLVAMQLENTRLLERDRDRINELSLLNSISRQFNSSLHEYERVRNMVAQRAKEIASADLCYCLLVSDPPGTVSWIPPDLQTMLVHDFSGTNEANSEPLVIERTGNDRSGEYFKYLTANVKTFFVLPLWRSRRGEQAMQTGAWTHEDSDSIIKQGIHHLRSKPTLLGVIVGAYSHPWKLRREEVVMLSVLANQASSVLENIALVADVVEARNEARKLLRQVLDDQRFKEFILESIPGGLITVDLHGQMTTVNHAAQVMLGYHPYEVIGQSSQKIFPWRILQYVMQSGTSQMETLTVADRDGQDRTLDVTFLPLRDDRGQIIGVLATFSDVTIVRRLEEEKRRLDRLASLGEMAASVAHEVRNPLASIKTSMQMLLDDLAEGAPNVSGYAVTPQIDDGMRDSVRVVLKEVERLDSIVRDLLLFSRPRSLHPVECNVVEICERVLSLIANLCKEANVIVHRAYHDILPALVDIAQVEQVLLNLCLNALQAMNEGGILTVCCQVRQKSALDLLAEIRNWLEITVSDTGTGIAPDRIERIFQPFYTTKAHGIGLGLPISRRLVEDHHGALYVESQSGYGATFTMQLPLPDGRPGERSQVDEEERLS